MPEQYWYLKGMNNEITVKLDSPKPYLQFCVGLYI